VADSGEARRARRLHAEGLAPAHLECEGCGALMYSCGCEKCVAEVLARHCLCGPAFVDVTTGRDDTPPAT